MKVVPIDSCLIDFQNKSFLVGNKDNLSTIYDSISEIGVLNPPILRKIDDKYQVVSGWKRLLSCQHLGHTEVLCKIYDYSELSDSDCLKIVFLDNKERISDLELSELILLYKKIEPIDDKDIINKILPLLEIPPTRKHLDKYLSLASLDEVIKNAFYADKITIEQCQMLSELTLGNQVPTLEGLLLKYNLNNNESRQLIQIIEEISLRDSISVNEVISIAEIAVDNKKRDKNALRQELRRIRYPDLLRVEEKYKTAVNNLRLPKQVSLYINQFFEGNDLELRIKIGSTQELSYIMGIIDDLVQSGEIDDILSVIKSSNE